MVSRLLPVFEYVNLQTALYAWTSQPGRSVAIHGVTIPRGVVPETSRVGCA